MTENDFEQLDPRHFIIIKGAKMHNLKNVSLAIPRKKFTVITGLSGSGKSSLALDTLYAEGQRRYVESLSSYARQFLGRLDKPEVDYIKGISPAVAIEQRVIGRNARSTVGTSTEIYDYLKLLFARIGKTYSPISGNLVKRQRTADVVNFLAQQASGMKAMILFPFILREGRSAEQQWEILMQQGYSRAYFNGDLLNLSMNELPVIGKMDHVEVLVDRIVTSKDEEGLSRIADSVELAFFEGQGHCIVRLQNTDGQFEAHHFSNLFELDGMRFEEPTPNFFSFNNPVGACKKCEGYGSVIGIDPALVMPNPNLSVYEDGIVCWRGEKMSKWKEDLIHHAHHFDFPVHTPLKGLTPKEMALLWEGNRYFQGLHAFFAYLEEKAYKIQYRVMLSRYRGKTECPDCRGTKLRKDASYVKIGGVSMLDILSMSLEDCAVFFKELSLDAFDEKIANRLLMEINNRLKYLLNVGLPYLTLNRNSNTLSGGESQRINLATSLGSSLVGSMYILDEPSIGLHPRDTQKLISVLQDLKNLGNTVIVVEHDEDLMSSADHIVDMGPEAGIHGGQVVFDGNFAALKKAESLTAKYLTGRMKIPVPSSRRTSKAVLRIEGARKNNLKDISVSFPLHCLTVVTGVSGSGKSTLVTDLLYPAVKRYLENGVLSSDQYGEVSGDLDSISSVEYIDQNPIGKSSRSNPVTYVKAYDDIRGLMGNQPLSKNRAYKPATFSFNVAGGRCDHCEGEGVVTIEMQFMADIKLPCEFCKGSRFKDEVLDVKYQDKSIADILEMTVDESMEFFARDSSTINKRLIEKLLPLQQVGLGYIGLGQPANTLSGGEAQRVKLASFLSKGEKAGNSLFIFDEPTTGLHFHDINRLLDAFNLLIRQGHSIVLIEHDLDLIKNADWIIDLGPEGGNAGGSLIFQGNPEDLLKVKESYTAHFLKAKMNK